MEGRIVHVDIRGQCGFIKALGVDARLMFRAAQLLDLDFTSALVGVLVEFDVADSPHGPRAEKILTPLFPPVE